MVCCTTASSLLLVGTLLVKLRPALPVFALVGILLVRLLPALFLSALFSSH